MGERLTVGSGGGEGGEGGKVKRYRGRRRRKGGAGVKEYLGREKGTIRYREDKTRRVRRNERGKSIEIFCR